MEEEKKTINIPADLPPCPPERTKRRGFWRIFLWIATPVIALILLAVGAAFGYAKLYENKIYPGVYLDGYHLGKMSQEELINFMEGLNNRLSKEGINFLVNKGDGTEETVKINTVSGGDNSIELVKFDGKELAQKAYSVGRTGEWWKQLFYPGYFLLSRQLVSAPVAVNDNELKEVLKSSLGKYADEAHDATIKVVNWQAGSYEIVPEKNGKDFDYNALVKEIKDNLEKLSFAEIKAVPQTFPNAVNFDDAKVAGTLLSTVFGYGDLNLNYIDPQTNLRKDWKIMPSEFAEWVLVKKDNNNQPILSLDKEKVLAYLENLRSVVDMPAQDAKFSIQDGKVKEFQASRTGLTLDAEKTGSNIITVFEERNYHPESAVKNITLDIAVAEPNIKMSDVNQLGISDVIGVGVSSFKGSHTNRIKNIANAVKRLNGTLIQPGEEFSANKYAGPFTLENGFLPELVIKGDEIKKEVGGGMCQIGTTLFRMAMNSGMDITERRNHSLVVNYYADPVNGNPGTDATLYEPILDLKFKNDTGNYLLLQTDVDYKTMQLTFTLWGKSDGRKGSYTHPLVSKWIAPGTPVDIETEKLKPGEKECQDAYRGAVASFTYTRITPAGEEIKRVFDSYYRPLPRICRIGKAEAPVCKEGEICPPSTGSASSNVSSDAAADDIPDAISPSTTN